MLRMPGRCRSYESPCSAARTIIDRFRLAARRSRHDRPFRSRAVRGVLARHAAGPRSGRDARVARGVRRARRGRRAPSARRSCCAGCSITRARSACSCRRSSTRRTATRSRSRTSRSFPGNLEIEQRLVGDRALERARDGGARQPRARRTRRPHRELRVGGGSVRGRLQPFLPRAGQQPATSSTSSRTPRPASTRAPSSKGG